jgi:hypothetical protein
MVALQGWWRGEHDSCPKDGGLMISKSFSTVCKSNLIIVSKAEETIHSIRWTNWDVNI